MKIDDKKLVDLHIHTNASDGTWSPEELLEKVIEKNIGFFSVTDHDSIENIAKVRELAIKYSIPFVHGVEISSSFSSEWFHILAYGFNLESKEMLKLIDYNQKLMQEKDDNSIKLLIKEGYKIDYDDYKNYSYERNKGGWKSLNYLIEEGLCSDVQDFFGRIFSAENRTPFPVFNNPKEIIDIIKKSEGTAVLAHPSYGNSNIPLNFILEQFYAMGIDGVECYHPNHSEEATEHCIRFCNDKKLLTTAGSDCHGLFIKNRTLGSPKVLNCDLNLGKLLKY